MSAPRYTVAYSDTEGAFQVHEHVESGVRVVAGPFQYELQARQEMERLNAANGPAPEPVGDVPVGVTRPPLDDAHEALTDATVALLSLYPALRNLTGGTVPVQVRGFVEDALEAHSRARRALDRADSLRANRLHSVRWDSRLRTGPYSSPDGAA